MFSDQLSPTQYLKAILCGALGLSEKSAALLIEEHGKLAVQRHAMYCLWMMDQGKVHAPASLVDRIAHRRLERAARDAERLAANGAAFPRG